MITQKYENKMVAPILWEQKVYKRKPKEFLEHEDKEFEEKIKEEIKNQQEDED